MERIARNAPTLLLAAAFAAAAAMTLVLTSGHTFFQDTWGFLIDRRELTADTLFTPHNEHLVVFPVLIQQLLVQVFGMSSALPEYLLLIVFLLATAGLLYVYLERRVGPWLALFPTVILLCLGPAWEVLVWPFEITFIGPLLFGLAMLLALERADRRGDVAACAFLTLAIGFSGLGISFLAAAAVAILQGERRTWLRRAYIVAIPLAFYAFWWLGWGHDAETHMSLRNILDSPVFVVDSIAVALASIAGLGTPIGGAPDLSWGRALLVGLVIVVGYRQLRDRPKVPAGLWPVAAAAAANWFLTAFNEFAARAPISSRYQYASAIFIFLILGNLFDGVRPGRRVLVAFAAATALAIGPSLTILYDGSKIQEQQSVLTRADTAAIEIARSRVDPDFQLTEEVAGTPSLVNIYAGKYLEAVDEYGSPAYSQAELAAAPELGRRQADIVLANALALSTVTDVGAYSTAPASGDCVLTGDGDGAAEVRVPPGKTTIAVPPGPRAEFVLRRFATEGFPVTTEGAPGDSVTVLRVPPDASPRPWRLHVEAEQTVRVCG